ncbi:MAG: hypothetical protein QW702_05925 [Candidatus Bathyarchaeia archaeon]
MEWGKDFRIYDEDLFLLMENEKEREIFLKECHDKLKRALDALSW